MSQGLPTVPERADECPEKIDELANPQIASEAPPVDLEGEQERFLQFSPLAREASSEQLSPTKDCLFLSKTS
jgi:hypothetical protein